MTVILEYFDVVTYNIIRVFRAHTGSFLEGLCPNFCLSPPLICILSPPPLIIRNLVNASVGETVILQCSAISYGIIDNLKYKVIDDDKRVAIDGASSSKFVINHIYI